MKFLMKIAIFLMVASYCIVESSAQASSCEAFEVVTRDEWGSLYPVGGGELITPVNLVFIHHTDMEECNDTESCSAAVRHIQDYHVNHNGWDDIGYNFCVGGDGKVYVARGWDHIGAQTYGWNNQSEGIAMLGTYQDKLPNEAMITTANNLIKCGLEMGKISDDYGLYGHRDGSCTTCPGDALYAELQSWPQWHFQGTIHQNCANDTTPTP